MTISNKKFKNIKPFLGIAAIATTLYLIMLGWYNTLSLDDYSFAVAMRVFNPFTWAKHMYLTWQGRFSSFVVSGIIFKIFGNISYLKIWTILHLSLGYIIVWLYVRNIFCINDKFVCITLSVLLSNIAICSVFEISTFYWLCCAGYFLVIYATLMLIYVLFLAKWKMKVRYIFAVLCAIYISGSAENYTPLVLLVLGSIWLYRIICDTKSSSFAFAFKNQKFLFIVCTIICIGFLIMFFAPGNKVRANQGGEIIGFIHQFRIIPFLKKTIIANAVFFVRLLSRGLYILGVIPIAIWVGIIMKKHNVPININNIWKRIFLSTTLLVLLIFIAVTSCVYGIGYYPPLRSMGYILYLALAWALHCGILIGYHYEKKIGNLFSGCCIACLCLWAGYGVYYTVKEQPVAKKYFLYITERNKTIQILNKSERKDPLTIQPIVLPYWPNTYSCVRTFINRCLGMDKTIEENYFPYMAADLSDDPNDFKNKGLQHYFNADFEILGYSIEFQ